MARIRNTSGGGANTNVNGLRFERETALCDLLVSNGYTYDSVTGEVSFREQNIGLLVEKHKLYKIFLESKEVDWKARISKLLLPDEAFVNEQTRKVYIIEKKFQENKGSVDEKLQTCAFKKKQYSKLLTGTGYTVVFIFLLCDFYRDEKYRDVLSYVEDSGCAYYFNVLPLEAIGLEEFVLDD